MTLLPGWGEILARADGPTRPAPDLPAVPLCPSYFAGRVTVVATAEEAGVMAALAAERRIGWVGIDTEFKYDRPGVVIDRDHTAHDPRSVRPLLLSLALAEPTPGGGARVYRFVVDVRRPEVLGGVRAVLGRPVPFVGHFLRAELYCLWQLGLEEPRTFWDTWVGEKALHLGFHHWRYLAGPAAEEPERARAAAEAGREERFRLSLPAACRRYAVPYPFGGDKDRLRKSFLGHPDGAPFTAEQIDYAAADAVAAAGLYLPQTAAVAQAGLLHHLVTVEMPWVATNARMGWRGVRVDREKARRVAAACERHMARLGPELAAAGVTNVKSHPQLLDYFRRQGLLPHFRSGRGYTFAKRRLEEVQDRHPAIALIRAARRVRDLEGERILTGAFEGADGRVHPQYRQLGADTGRQSSRWPNVLGLGRVFRPLVVPEPGRGIGEVDLSQIEVGIAGAVYGDERLVAMFNTGDVYAAMAQHFYRDQISEADRGLDSRAFKARYKPHRDRMKACTLGIIYGVTPLGLARQLGTGVPQAAALLDRFLGMFPALRRAQAAEAASAAARGYAATATGLRRHRAAAGAPVSNWERNWMVNHPVQGTAAALFKAAGNRLDRLYRRHDAWLLIGLHDAFVYEAPLEVLGEVGELTRRVMCEALEEFFPELRPRAEVNDQKPYCWNKDGHADSVERWIENPMFTF
jgi:DNA polymerase-1